MPEQRISFLRRAWRVLAAIGRGVDLTRRLLLNTLLLGLVVGAVAAVIASRPGSLRDKTVLVLKLEGRLSEQKPGGPRGAAMAQLQGDAAHTRLRDVLAALDAAAKDPQISRVLLMLDDFSGAGLASLREVAAAMDRFKASGKPVIAWGLSFDQRQYFLAAHASEVYLHPMGAVMIEGLGRHRTYFKDALDKLGVNANVLRAGKYKNAGEPFFANKPSPESIESDKHVMDAVWLAYTQGVEKARQLPAGSVMRTINALPDALLAAGGSAARLALQNQWVTALKTQDELRVMLIEQGAKDREGHTFRQIGFNDYLARLPAPARDDAVAVVVAEGEIVDGKAAAGRVGGDSTAAIIRRAREDERIKAVVLRVNSPGGSALASELIRRELELTREAGKPVVVSMGDVAASGGYWISMAANEVIAEPNTITGSIGVFGMLPTAEGLMAKIGLGTGGYRTTWLAGGYDVRSGLDPRYAKLVQASIEHIYAEFIDKAARARKTTAAKIDAVAQGRIWTGAQAQAHGLVDRTGSLADALQSARTLAKLPADAPERYLESEGKPWERLLSIVDSHASDWATTLWATHHPVPAAMLQAQAQLHADTSGLTGLLNSRQPFAAVVHCLCRITP